ncbi:MAG: cyclase family protein [Saprospiraceae bacterium]|nr:cyclase family protein [Saprospiraceae bacterium]
MQIRIYWNGKAYVADLQSGIDISIPFKEGYNQVNCFYAPFFNSQAVKSGDFIGSVSQGGPVNFFNTFINIHGGGTHTECCGHITTEREHVNGVCRDFFGMACLISVYPTQMEDGDRVITKKSLQALMEETISTDFIIIRTLPNDHVKTSRHYSGTNPPYVEAEAMSWLVEKAYHHLLIDLPSVDKEMDGGLLACHHIFWKGDRKKNCTITELVYIPDQVKDGYYFLNLQVAPIESDASPSRPVLYSIHPE